MKIITDMLASCFSDFPPNKTSCGPYEFHKKYATLLFILKLYCMSTVVSFAPILHFGGILVTLELKMQLKNIFTLAILYLLCSMHLYRDW